MRARLIQLLAAVVIGSTTLHAQVQRPPVDVDGRRLAVGVDSLAIYLVRDDDTTRTGMLWDELATIDVGQRRAIRRVYRSEDRILGTRVDTIVDELPTLVPIRSRSVSREGLEVLDFAPGRVRGWMRLINGDSVAIDVELAGATYNASTFDLLLRAAPLRDGWRVEIPAFFPNTRTVVPLTAKLAGTDRIGTALCWRVDAQFGRMPVTFWVDQRSRRLCQQVMHVQPGVQILFAPARTEPSSKRAS